METASQTTASTVGENQTLEGVIRNDKVRYQRKGYGLIVSFIIFLSYFYFSPIILRAIWPSISSLGPQKYVQLALTFFIPQIILLIGCGVYYLIYIAKSPFFERYKILDRQWPWDENPQEWRKMLNKSIKQILFNQYICLLPLMTLDVFYWGADKCRFDTESMPELYEILWQVVFMMLCEDFAFYWAHRFLHEPFFYKRIHKIHHEYYNSICITAVYAHPIEYILGNSVPTALGFMILGNKCHFITYIIWLGIRLTETLDGHCGYEFSWSPYRLLPFSGSSEYHNYHHSHNVGTFGSFFIIWDTVFKTNKDFFAYQAKKQKEEQLNVLRKQHEEDKKAK